MDPNVALIVNALSTSVSKLAEPIVHDTYNGLKGLIKKKFPDNTKIQEVIDSQDMDLEAWQSALTRALVEVSAGNDAEVVAAAQALQGHIKLIHGSEITHMGTGDILKENARKITTQGDYVEGNQMKYIPPSKNG